MLDGTINNVTNYTFNKVTSNAFKSSGYSTSSVDIKLPKYTYLDNDNENLNSEIYALNSTYSVIKFIDRINTFYTDSIGTSIYSNNNLSRRYTNSNQILSFILPNIDIDKTSGDVLNQLSNNIFKTYLNFNNSSEISYLGIKYIFDDNKYLKTSEVTGEKINNIIKRVINYQLIDKRLIIDEIFIGYECTDGICKFYPITEINNEQKNYYDFTTSSIDMDEILKNVDKINHYTWTFVNENDNFYFDSIQLN